MQTTLRTVLYALIALVLAGCAAAQSRLNQSVDIKNYKDIAVFNFTCSDATIGEKTAGKFAVRLEWRGFNVFGQDKLKKITGREISVESALTDPGKSMLEANGIKAVVVGQIPRYECETKNTWTWTGFAPEKIEKHRCHASLSIKMVDIGSGETIWEAEDSQSEYEKGMTAQTVLGIILSRIENELPRIPK